MTRNAMNRTHFWALLIPAVVLALAVNGCYYKQDYDSRSGPYGTGTQGYRLTVRMTPDLLPADGTSSATIEVRFINLETGAGIPNQPVYVALYEVDATELVIGPWDTTYLFLSNEQSRTEVVTDEGGVGRVAVHTRDSFVDRNTWDIKYGEVFAEVNTEFDRTQLQFDATDFFKLYNPYF